MNEFTVVVGTRNNIEWVEIYLHSLYTTAYNKDIKVIITDQSTEDNYDHLKRECSKYPNKVQIVHYNESLHHITELLKAIEMVETRYCLYTHIDAIFLYDNWDIEMLEKMEKYPVFATADKDDLHLPICRDGIFVKTEFIFSEPKLILDSKFNHFLYIRNSDGASMGLEHGYLTIEMMKRGQGDLVLPRKVSIYGNIYHCNDKEFLYHCSYSSRLRPDTSCPVPLDEFKNGNVGLMHVDKQPLLLMKWFIEYRPHGVTLEKFINDKFKLLLSS